MTTSTPKSFSTAVRRVQRCAAPDAWDIFQRDVTRLCQYFQNYGLGRHPDPLAADLWNRFAYPRGPEAPDPVEEEMDED